MLGDASRTRDGAATVEIRLTPGELRDVQAWIAAHWPRRPALEDAVKMLVKAGLDASWRGRNTRGGPPDEGLRPEQLTCENDG